MTAVTALGFATLQTPEDSCEEVAFKHDAGSARLSLQLRRKTVSTSRGLRNEVMLSYGLRAVEALSHVVSDVHPQSTGQSK